MKVKKKRNKIKGNNMIEKIDNLSKATDNVINPLPSDFLSNVKFLELKNYLQVCSTFYEGMFNIVCPENDYLIRMETGDVGNCINTVLQTITTALNNNKPNEYSPEDLYYNVFKAFNDLMYIFVGFRQFKKYVNAFKQSNDVVNPFPTNIEAIKTYLDSNVKQFEAYLKQCFDIIKELKKEVKERQTTQTQPS